MKNISKLPANIDSREKLQSSLGLSNAFSGLSSQECSVRSSQTGSLRALGGVTFARQPTTDQDEISIELYARVLQGLAIFVRKWFRNEPFITVVNRRKCLFTQV